MIWNIALLQMDVAFGQPEQNREKVRRMAERVAQWEEHTDIAVLPELWDTAYDLERLTDIADKNGEQAKRLLSDTARALKGYVIGGSVAEQLDHDIYNTMYVFDHNGQEAARYSKVHLFRLMQEEKYFSPGEKPGLFLIDGHLCGSVICYDIRFPEWIRTYALFGTKVLFVSAQWPHPRLNHWRQLLIARAIENQMYVVACNRVGTGGKSVFCGHSMVINPWGEVIAEGTEEEEIITAQIDLSLVDEVRGRIPVFEDRIPELYRLE